MWACTCQTRTGDRILRADNQWKNGCLRSNINRMGLKGMIGKGPRHEKVITALKEHGAVYFAAIGGAAAVIAQSVKKAEIVAYPELGPEAVYRLEVQDFPCIVAIDSEGNNLYESY